MDRLDAMRAFAAVAECRSFVEAARRLRLSASGVSRAVALLEDELGVSLLTRTTRSVHLTQRGSLYLETCTRILADIDDAKRLVRGQDARPQGRMTIAAPLLFGRLHVLPVVERMLQENRELSVRLMLNDRVVGLIEEGIDVSARIGELSDSGLRAVKLGEVRRVLVASPAYLRKYGVPKQPAELPRHRLIVFEGTDSTDMWQFGTGDKRGLRISPVLTVNSADAAIAAAVDGLGVTRALSYQVSAPLRKKRLRLVLDDFTPAPVPVSLVYPERRATSANVDVFVRAMRAHLSATRALLMTRASAG